MCHAAVEPSAQELWQILAGSGSEEVLNLRLASFHHVMVARCVTSFGKPAWVVNSFEFTALDLASAIRPTMLRAVSRADIWDGRGCRDVHEIRPASRHCPLVICEQDSI